MAAVFWMSRLKAGVAATDYETWVREFDYVKAKELSSLRSYRTYRIQEPFLEKGSTPIDYLEVIEVTDVEAYRRELAEHPAALAITQVWDKYVELVYSLSGELIPPGVSREVNISANDLTCENFYNQSDPMEAKHKVEECRKQEEVMAQIISGGIIAIVRGDYRSQLLPIAEVLIEEGVPAIEVTMNSPDALAAIEELSKAVGDRMRVGAGTVVDPGTVKEIAGAGGCFIVAPNVNAMVVEAAIEADLLVIPGAYTPTEIEKAWRLGAKLVKLFPASVGGPAYLRAMHGPLGHIPMVPTGGVSGENAAVFVAAGAFALGIGESLVNPDILAPGGMERLGERARSLIAAVAEGRVSV